MSVKKSSSKGKKKTAASKPSPRKVIPLEKKPETKPLESDPFMEIYWAEDEEVDGKTKNTGS
jgi:hypothetical protein